ncbi:MAG: EamA family transporter [Eubacteriales bacterium]|nr:EamA family transporter [Eubacteriales bacterium]
MSFFAFMTAVVLTAVSSVMLKISAIRFHINTTREYINPLVMSAYFMQGIATFLTIIGYQYVPLSIGQVLASFGQVMVMILSLIVLKERISPKKWIGMGLILTGIYIATVI